MATVLPTYYGYIESEYDALLLFESCLSGVLKPIINRPDKARLGNLAQSGNIFIFDEDFSGIKRWTDAVGWSASRKRERFLIYHQSSTPGDRRFRRTQEGLFKKSMTVKVEDISLHLVSYYTTHDVQNGKLSIPSNDCLLQSISPRSGLSQNFLDIDTNSSKNPTPLQYTPLNDSTCEDRKNSGTMITGQSGAGPWRNLPQGHVNSPVAERPGSDEGQLWDDLFCWQF
jgi:hypothetical protein